MRPVKMDRLGLLAAAMYAILENRRYRKLIVSFSVELMPTMINGQTLFGNTITGYIKIDNHIRGKEFTIGYKDDGNLRIEIPRKRVVYTKPDTYVAYVDTKEPIEINFDKRSITYKTVIDFDMEKAAWDWYALNGIAADIIGTILGEENS